MSRSVQCAGTTIRFHPQGEKVSCAAEKFGSVGKVFGRDLVSFDFITDTGDKEPIYLTESFVRELLREFPGRRRSGRKLISP